MIANAQVSKLEDPLAHLPRSEVVLYKAKQIIYDGHRTTSRVYLVVSGFVVVTRLSENGTTILQEIYGPDDLFGLSSVFGAWAHDRAIALSNCSLMSWGSEEVNRLVMLRPRLGVGLTQVMTRQTLDLARRLEGHAYYRIPARLASTLIHFWDRFSTVQDDGSTQLFPLTHTILSWCVGTSRGLVSHHMNLLKLRGLVDYSRRRIIIDRAGLFEVIRSNKESRPKVMRARVKTC